MGFPSFSGVSAGLLVIINTVVSVQSFKDIVKSFMEILGLFFTTTSAHDTHTQLNLNTYRSTTVAESPSSSRSRYPESPVLDSELAQLPFIAEEIRENLPVVPYQSTANTHVGECAVCLSKFEEEDQIRELPCCHLFHRICLDKWLDHQQTTCPLCRSSLIPEETANRLRRREQELTEELMFWFSSFHGHGFHSMWWLR